MDTSPSSLQIRILIFRRWHYPVTWGGAGIRSPFNRLYWLDCGRGLVAHERQRRRIERAQFRLHDTAAGVAEIAAELGFCDQFHFSRVFRAITGCSPLQYRKNRLPSEQG